MLHPHVSTLLEGQEWDYWRRKLDGLSYREDAMQQARSGFEGLGCPRRLSQMPLSLPRRRLPPPWLTSGGEPAPCGAMA